MFSSAPLSAGKLEDWNVPIVYGHVIVPPVTPGLANKGFAGARLARYTAARLATNHGLRNETLRHGHNLAEGIRIELQPRSLIANGMPRGASVRPLLQASIDSKGVAIRARQAAIRHGDANGFYLPYQHSPLQSGL